MTFKVILFSLLIISLIITPYFSKATAQSIVPGIHGFSTVEGVLFTWIIISSESEISINLRYNGVSNPPPIFIIVTASSINQSQKSSTMGASQLLDANWTSPTTLTIKVNGSSSLYDADLITVGALPYNPSMPTPLTKATPETGSPTGTGAVDQNNCDPSYPDFCIPPPPPDKDCSDIVQNNFRVQGTDPHDLDRDKNGFGCDS